MHVTCEASIVAICFSSNAWTLSPRAGTSDYALNVNSNDYVNNNNVNNSNAASPADYH